MAKKLKVVKICMCPVCWCVYCMVHALFLHHTTVNIYVLDFAHDNTDVLWEHPEDGHVDWNM
jgi:hypothetical protein